MSSENDPDAWGCLAICIGLGIVLLCGLHGCAAVITALKS